MSVTNDPQSPMYVPEENRRIARERARQRVDLIADYLEARDTIPTGFTDRDRLEANRERILSVLGGTEEEWKDYRWHIKHAIRDTGTLAKIIELSRMPGRRFMMVSAPR